ncbi:FAD-dependent monooxygenase [Pseudorhodoferax sp.]|uniref:FAD-dependent monooxygenase n=1 Tax=Pseudorhodoferax sp. TaxID=1993553 RepID=UPI002DD6609E|nr:FAD-dependent monooxygenase [Pseudorhodoferax sp.]
MDTEVLIVGAGPTGLMLAIQLARAGLKPMVIDRHAGPAQQSRALGVQARTLEIYARMGLADRALALGTIATGANLWAEGRRLGHVPFGRAGAKVSPYPYILVLGQDDNEHLMGERLRALGVEIAWNTELVALTHEADRVRVRLKDPDGSERQLGAAWVAGCDGSRSAVRELNGIGFPGPPYEHVFFVADVTATGDMVPGEVNVFLWKKGFHLFFPMRGSDHWRVVGILDASLRDRAELRFTHVIPSIRAEAGDTLAFQDCAWFSTYRIHHRRAARFRKGRCFLLGDAAHVHSPVGAQGMNTGLQDAYNLGWKLARVADGRAAPALLDSYEAERIPVAERLLDTTDRAFRAIVSDNPLAALLRTQVLARVAALAMRSERVQALAFRTVSQTAIGYRGSALSQEASPMTDEAPRAGDRFPWLQLQLAPDAPAQDLFGLLDDTRWTLLLFGQPVPQGLPLDVVALAVPAGNDGVLARAHIAQPSFYLLRPDGHVGLCGAGFSADAMRGYFADRVHLR